MTLYHWIPHHWILSAILGLLVVLPVVLFAASVILSHWAKNGVPMRFAPSSPEVSESKSLSWYMEGNAKDADGPKISCSFVEFDERGDFLDFNQHRHCERQIKDMAAADKPVLVVMYCHGWKNNSHSEDVVKFNSFLAKIAAVPEVYENGFRVHGVYLSWRGNTVRPFVDKTNGFYRITEKGFGVPIVDPQYSRWTDKIGFIPENVNFFTRQRAAEHLVSALPMARAIFTYASTAKKYGARLENQVIVMGHSMGALMLERSLGQAMTGSIVMEWWDNAKKAEAEKKVALPFDLVLFLNSAAPSIYAKEMRDFLEAHRNAPPYRPGRNAPVIISLTSTADWATGKTFRYANGFLARLRPSLKRRYTTGIFGAKGQTHRGIRQSEFYSKTPGHQPYLLNHWIVSEETVPAKTNASADQVFAENISQKSPHDPHIFFTSEPAKVWRIKNQNRNPVMMDGLPLAMQNSNYWIMSCGKELISGHGDIWSTKTMEMYAGLYRLAIYLKNAPANSGG